MVTAAMDTPKNNSKKNISVPVKWAGNILFVILLLTVAFMTVFTIQSRKSSSNVLGGYKMFIVLSGSMNPAFDTGSVVFVKPIDPREIVVGDIITFKGSKDSKNTTTHRVVEVHKQYDLSFTTKGDANQVVDPVLLYPENVVGKVIFSIPYIGYILNFASTKGGTYLLVILPLMIVIFLEGRKIFLHLVKERSEKELSKLTGNEREKSTAAELENLKKTEKTPVDDRPKTVKNSDIIRPSKVIFEEAVKTEQKISGTAALKTQHNVAIGSMKDSEINARTVEVQNIIDKITKQERREEPVLQKINSTNIPENQKGSQNSEVSFMKEPPKLNNRESDSSDTERNKLFETIRELQDILIKKRENINRLKESIETLKIKALTGSDVKGQVEGMITAVQMESIEKLYRYKVQVVKLEKELMNALYQKKIEDENLDRSVSSLKEELHSKLSEYEYVEEDL